MSSRLKIVPFDENLLTDFKYDGIEKSLSGEEILPIVKFYNKMGDSFIGIIDNEVIGIGGLYPLWPSAGSCYLFLNRSAYLHKIIIFKAILKYMNILIHKYNIDTLTVDCLSEEIKASNLIEHLGFTKTKEFKLTMYCKGV